MSTSSCYYFYDQEIIEYGAVSSTCSTVYDNSGLYGLGIVIFLITFLIFISIFKK